jgi:hypothetical protein
MARARNQNKAKSLLFERVFLNNLDFAANNNNII